MFETLSTVALTIGASIVVAFLSQALARTPPGRLTVGGVLAAWFLLVLAIGAAGVLSSGDGAGVPGLGLTVAAPAAALTGAFFAFPSIRSATLATPLAALVAVNAIRVLGLMFVALYAAGKLPAPFAPSAGWGDIFVGVTALPLAWGMLRFGSRVRGLVLLWNVIGIADLVNAVALGAMSAPGPLQVFAGPPTSALMTSLPWLIIPGFLVPSLVFIHIVIFYRLAKSEAAAPAHPWVSSGAARGGASV
ncbi:MAG TPA: hypothetical protein VF886_10050 [Roseiarcus sp.]